MSDDPSLAFAMPEARAAAAAKGDPLDRIAVRDYTRKVEIGAFQAERGVSQRVRFNVVVEVARHAAARSDDVDQVLSYDTIVQAIDAQLHHERINLLETLAERIAARILASPRAVRVFVRIEKLDRIPGRLGVEIVRARIAGENVLHAHQPVPPEEPAIHPLVVFLPNRILHGPDLTRWLDAVAAHPVPAILCVECAGGGLPRTDAPAANRRIALLSIEQNAWVLAGKDARCVVIDSRTELDWAIRHGQLSVWAPSKIVLDSRDPGRPRDCDPRALAAWFAGRFSADALVLAGLEGRSDDPTIRHVPRPEDL